MSQFEADLILYNGRIFTADLDLPWAEAVACKDGRILAVGKYTELAYLKGPNSCVIDLAGRLAIPGLTDAHVHFLWYAMQQRLKQVDLYGINDFSIVIQRIRRAVENAGPGQWIHGWGWDETNWGVKPSLALLDDVGSNVSIALRRKDLHTWWVNRRALELAGITRQTPDPPGSRLGRDEMGELTGVLHEWAAIQLVEEHIPEPKGSTAEDWLRETIAEAHRLGLTSIHDQRLQNEGPKSLRAFLALQRKGELDLRICAHITAESLSEIESLMKEIEPVEDRLWLGQVKIFADGTMGARTALMLEPFEGEITNYGLAVTPTGEMRRLADLIRLAGYPVSVHAIGDRAVRETIDVMGKFSWEKSARDMAQPYRIEHVQLIHPDDLPRLHQHQVIASMQPVHLILDWQTADRVWGNRARYAYAFRSLLNCRTRLAFGSDAPFAPLNPMLGIYAAVTRQDDHGEPEGGWHPEEKLTVAEAVHGYTMGPAYAAGKQHVQGSVSPGKWADLIVLDRDIFEIDPVEIAGTQVEMTIFDGRLVYERSS
jgi:predicted amidohydrolase YtcJ